MFIKRKAIASFPPTAFVSMTAEETGGGIQLRILNLKMIQSF